MKENKESMKAKLMGRNLRKILLGVIGALLVVALIPAGAFASTTDTTGTDTSGQVTPASADTASGGDCPRTEHIIYNI